MYLFDTNIFLEILLNQDQADSCQKALSILREDQPGWVTSFSLHAMEAIMGSARRISLLEHFLDALSDHPYLFSYSTTIEEEKEISQLSPKIHLDFDDTLQFYVAKKKDLILVTLDRDFKSVKGIEVILPCQIES